MILLVLLCQYFMLSVPMFCVVISSIDQCITYYNLKVKNLLVYLKIVLIYHSIMIFVKYEQYLLKAQNPNYLLPLMHLKHSNK